MTEIIDTGFYPDIPPAAPTAPLEFESSGDIPTSHLPEHPIRQYLESLIPSTLTQDQRCAIEEYSGNYGHQKMTDELRAGHVSVEAQEIDLAMLQTQLPQDTIVYRAENPRPTTPEEFPSGFSEPNPCFISTTLDPAVARNWRGTATISRIFLPAGTHVAVGELAEAELILPRESILETHSAHAEVDQTGKFIVYVDKSLVPGSRALEEAKLLQAERDGYAATFNGPVEPLGLSRIQW